MGICHDCGKSASTSWGEFDNLTLCWDCHEKRYQAKILKESESVHSCSDFKNWDHGDLSELFWIHLGIYVKHPNRDSLSMITRAIYWANHDSHGLSNAFYNALKWCGIDVWKERKRTDLPEHAPEGV